MSWWSNLSRGERATFFACFGGWALDAFDYQFYTFVIPTLRKEWNISAGEAGTLATAALLSSAGSRSSPVCRASRAATGTCSSPAR